MVRCPLVVVARLACLLLTAPPAGALLRTGAVRPTQGFVREAEQKHGRVALLALPTLAWALPTLAGVESASDAAAWLSRQPADVQLMAFAAAGVVEAATTLPRLGPRPFALKPGAVPGHVPPLPLPASARVEAVEDAAGRAAMLLTVAFLVHAVV